jgi:hypothetical protein
MYDLKHLRVHRANFATIAFVVALPALAQQQVMGTVSTHDAQITGGLQVQGERASLVTNAAVTAFDHTAPVTLTRGGEALVCSTSQFHLLHSGADAALLFGLDRGAFEIHGVADPHDIVLTPDIRFALENAGTAQAPKVYALSIRVTSNGDTCVQNSGPNAPTLALTDPFSSTTYRLIPGQHVLFEHGSLKEVVDNERESCGCPVEKSSAAMTPSEAAHPFPAAQSAGLVPVETPHNSTPDGQTHAQITETLGYNSAAPPAAPAPAYKAAEAEPPPAPPGAHDIGHSISHFFHRLFHPGEKPAR